MSIKKMQDTDDPCTFCGEVGLEMFGHADKHLCRNCATTVFMMFTRIDQLEEAAEEMSAEAVAEQGGSYKDADGVCSCPGCIMTGLMKTDDILTSLRRPDFKAEEVLKENGAGRSVH